MNWTPDELLSIIGDLRARGGDKTSIEVKSARGGLPDLADTLCAFANMPNGGAIVLGLDESQGFDAVGLADLAVLEGGIANRARQGVTPPVNVTFQSFDIAGRDVLVAHVAPLPLQDRPARHGGQAYLRASDGDYTMSPQELAQLELLKTQAFRRTEPDKESVPDTSIDDLDPDLLAAYIKATRNSSRRLRDLPEDLVLRYTGVTATDGTLTLAGLYAMGRYPQAHVPQLGITAAVQLPPGGGVRTRDLRHMTGPIPDLLEDAMAWVLRNTRSAMGYDSRGHGIDIPEIPLQAVREIVANALVHRNLDSITQTRSIEIRLTDDRLVISSPGGLWGVSRDELGQPGAKNAVNPMLYGVCKNLRMPDGSRVIEAEGGGIREAIFALRDSGLRTPVFTDRGIGFTVTLLRHTLLSDADLHWLRTIPAARGLSSEQRSILASLHRGEVWSNARVRDEFRPIDSREATRLLTQLVDVGVAVADGQRGGTTYLLAPALAGNHPVEPLPTEVNAPILNRRAAATERKAPPPRTRNGQTILDALAGGPASIEQLREATFLTIGQLRYSLRLLIADGDVVMNGSQGVHHTTYSLPQQAV